MSAVAVLQARVDALQGKVEKYRAYAKATRTASRQLSGSRDGLDADPVDLGGMQSRAPRIDRAQGRVASAQGTVQRVRGRVSEAVGELDEIAAKWERKADDATTQLAAAKVALAATVIKEALS
ncbi:MAG: hypothetical protein ACRDT4_24870 [Micromonosporaceae bacterium]